MKITYTRTAPNTWKATAGNRTLVVRKYTAMGESTYEVWNTINAGSAHFVANEFVGDAATLPEAKKLVRAAVTTTNNNRKEATMTTTTSTSKTTHDLRVGDIVRNDAMVLLIDQSIEQTSHPVNPSGAGGKTYATDALVTNFDELVAEAEAGNDHARWIVGMIRGDMRHKDANGRAHDGKPRWTIQGNGLATWGVIGRRESQCGYCITDNGHDYAHPHVVRAVNESILAGRA